MAIVRAMLHALLGSRTLSSEEVAKTRAETKPEATDRMSFLNAPEIIEQLAANGAVIQKLLVHVNPRMAVWKPAPEHWCLLEIVCHLCDEEREDFGARVKSTLDDPTRALVRIDPQGWVTDRQYMKQDFRQKVEEFTDARGASLGWLRALDNPSWENAFQHEKMGPLSARFFLENWLAHDYLHMRQINRRKYEYLRAHITNPLDYAGDW